MKKMTVKEVLEKINIQSDDNRIVKGLAFNSNDVEDGYIFVAYKGSNSDGNDYISKAFEKGAVCVVSDRLVGYDVYKADDIEVTKDRLCKFIYPSKKIKIIGITGTNGKTSTCHLLYQALNKLGKRTTYIGTLGVIDNNYFKALDNTTPNKDVLAREIFLAYKRKCEYVVMEVSSHSLSMNRVNLLDFNLVAFTNLSQDHLDYYKDMNEYFMAKKLLFDCANANCIGVINNEDTYSLKIIKDFKGKVVRYGKKSEYDCQLIESSLEGIKFEVNGNLIESKLVFETNLYNLLLTYTILDNLGIEINKIKEVIKELIPIQGRAEIIKNDKSLIVIDYAHTPDAMERIIKEANKIKKGKVSVVFGCGGNRDKLKRPIMGAIASTLADKIYITNDNPRFEKEDEIIKDILKGINNKNNVYIEYDRKKAINRAMDELTEGDILLILGKGHEDYQIIKDQKYHLSDREIVNEYIKEKEL